MRRIGGEGGGGGRARRSSVLHPILNRAGQALGRLQFDLKDIAAVPAICFFLLNCESYRVKPSRAE